MHNQEIAGSAQGLSKHFGDFVAVDQIDFSIHRGEIFGFLGPNGSGKTTTIRMMLGLLKPTSGKVEILGIPVAERPEDIRPKVGYMSQRFSLYDDLSVRENLLFYGRSYGLANETLTNRIKDALNLSGLEGRETMRTRDLSGGWRQRLALSAAILHRPELVILDEPTAGVDPISRRAFWDLLYQFISQGITVFVTTHYMDEAERCHRLAFIQRGQIIAMGSPEEIKSEMMHGEVLEIAPLNPAKTVLVLREASETGILQLDEVALYGSLVHVVAPVIRLKIEAIQAVLTQSGLDPGEMTIISPSLEDVFISCMR